MTTQWRKPVIETIFSIDEIAFKDDKRHVIKEHVATVYEDLRPGKEGRRAPITLVNRLSVEEIRELLTYDPTTGLFAWRTPQGRQMRTNFGLTPAYGYVYIQMNGCGYPAHCLAWVYMTGEWPKNVIDHINSDTRDNRFCNLRDVSYSENNMRKVRISLDADDSGAGVRFKRR